MSAVEDFIYSQNENQQTLLLYFHLLLTEDYNLESKIRYRIPFYYGHSWIIYLNPIKKNGIDFSFVRGVELSSDFGVLEARDRAQVRSITVYNRKEINEANLRAIIEEAIVLDETIPYQHPTKRKV